MLRFDSRSVRQLNTNELTSNRISTNVMPERAGFICMSVTSPEERLISVPLTITANAICDTTQRPCATAYRWCSATTRQTQVASRCTTFWGGLLCYSGRPFDPELCVLRFDSRSVRQLNTNELTLTLTPSALSRSWVVAGNSDFLLATSHRTAVCLSSATSSSYQNIQLTSSYISFYKDQ